MQMEKLAKIQIHSHIKITQKVSLSIILIVKIHILGFFWKKYDFFW